MHPSAYLEMAATEQRHWWFVGRRLIIESTIRDLRLPNEARILEVGAGTGGNLNMLSRYGKVSAVEMDEVAQKIAMERTGGFINVMHGTFPSDMPFTHETFDLICLFDVLEHIEQDTKTLISLNELLAENGRILLTVPAYPWLWGVHDEFLHHKRRYSKRELNSKAWEAGLHVSKLTHFNTLLFPLAVAIRLKDRLLRRKSASGTVLPLKAINAMLAAIFGFERFLLGRFNLFFGVSLLAIMEKR